MTLPEARVTAMPMTGLPSRTWHLAFLIFVASLTLFLVVRASNPERWSEWGFGDAQTMLTLQHWEEGGWFDNYLLFIPQGYAKVVRLFDEPRLRHHAHGTSPGWSPRVGPRLYYTHYPAGYLVPLAALFRLGLDSMSGLRMFSITLSVAALCLMYLLFSRLANPPVAFLAAAWYGLSPVFLGYADSLANHPLDDLLRFTCLTAIVASTRAVSAEKRRRWTAAAWGLAFLLSLSSFDSVFFVYVWLIGWDLIEGLGFRWRRYLLFAAAPVTAEAILILQNIWYFGAVDTYRDFYDTFFSRSGMTEQKGRAAIVAEATLFVIYLAYWKTELFIGVGLLFALYFGFLRRGHWEGGAKATRLALLLFACGMGYILVFPLASYMAYQGRQMLPFLALLAAGTTWSTADAAVSVLAPSGTSTQPRWFLLAYLFASSLVLSWAWIFLAYAPPRPPGGIDYRALSQQPDSLLAKDLTRLETRWEPVYFSLGGFDTFWNELWVPGYPQVFPNLEYYAGSRPILAFEREADVVGDIAYMVEKSPDRFSPVLIALDKERMKTIVESLHARGIISNMPGGPYYNFGRYVLDLSKEIQWVDDGANSSPR